MRRLELAGQIFGRWTVLHSIRVNERIEWLCRCTCGTKRSVIGFSLKSGVSISCGCFRAEQVIERETTHGMTGTRIHNIWKGLFTRCNNENRKSYKDYGGRGIKICERWNSFIDFYTDMYETYADNLTIERVDVNGDYEPSNCTWIEKPEQSKNRRPSSEWLFKNRLPLETAKTYEELGL